MSYFVIAMGKIKGQDKEIVNVCNGESYAGNSDVRYKIFQSIKILRGKLEKLH